MKPGLVAARLYQEIGARQMAWKTPPNCRRRNPRFLKEGKMFSGGKCPHIHQQKTGLVQNFRVRSNATAPSAFGWYGSMPGRTVCGVRAGKTCHHLLPCARFRYCIGVIWKRVYSRGQKRPGHQVRDRNTRSQSNND